MLPTAYDITDKVVFITGVGWGIGKGIAQVLTAAGADVVFNVLGPRYVEQTAAEIAKDTSRRVMPLLADGFIHAQALEWASYNVHRAITASHL